MTNIMYGDDVKDDDLSGQGAWGWVAVQPLP